jgi:hypothetical protein
MMRATGSKILLLALLAGLAAGCAENMEPVDGEGFAVEEAEEQVPGEEPAEAPADLGLCKVLPDGQLCASFNMLATYVRSVTITRVKHNPICNFQPFVDVYDAAGRRIAHEVGARHPGCRPGRVTVRLAVEADFPNGRKACAGLAEGFMPPTPLAPQICVPLFPTSND